MPKPWDQERIAGLIEMMQEVIEAADLGDDEATALEAILLPKLWHRSGLDLLVFHAAVSATLSNPDWAAFSSRRH